MTDQTAPDEDRGVDPALTNVVLASRELLEYVNLYGIEDPDDARQLLVSQHDWATVIEPVRVELVSAVNQLEHVLAISCGHLTETSVSYDVGQGGVPHAIADGVGLVKTALDRMEVATAHRPHTKSEAMEKMRAKRRGLPDPSRQARDNRPGDATYAGKPLVVGEAVLCSAQFLVLIARAVGLLEKHMGLSAAADAARESNAASMPPAEKVPNPSEPMSLVRAAERLGPKQAYHDGHVCNGAGRRVTARTDPVAVGDGCVARGGSLVLLNPRTGWGATRTGTSIPRHLEAQTQHRSGRITGRAMAWTPRKNTSSH